MLGADDRQRTQEQHRVKHFQNSRLVHNYIIRSSFLFFDFTVIVLSGLCSTQWRSFQRNAEHRDPQFNLHSCPFRSSRASYRRLVVYFSRVMRVMDSRLAVAVHWFKASSTAEAPGAADAHWGQLRAGQTYYSFQRNWKVCKGVTSLVPDFSFFFFFFRIVCISCPTLYQKLKELECHNEVVLLEFDKRFECYGDEFIFYDYNDPLGFEERWKGTCDVVVLDPPFLSEECLAKVSQTVKFLNPKFIILCTGGSLQALQLQPCTTAFAMQLQVPSWNRTLKAFLASVRASLSQHTQESWAMNSNALQTITWTNSAAENCRRTK